MGWGDKENGKEKVENKEGWMDSRRGKGKGFFFLTKIRISSRRNTMLACYLYKMCFSLS